MCDSIFYEFAAYVSTSAREGAAESQVHPSAAEAVSKARPPCAFQCHLDAMVRWIHSTAPPASSAPRFLFMCRLLQREKEAKALAEEEEEVR